MLKNILLITALCAFWNPGISQVAEGEQGNEAKFGYVDLSRAIRAHYVHIEKEAALDEFVMNCSDTLRQMNTEIEIYLASYLSELGQLDSAQMALRDRELDRLQQKHDAYADWFQETILGARKKLSEEIKTIILEEFINYTSLSDRLFIVHETCLVYCPECVDYTEDFMVFINRKKE